MGLGLKKFFFFKKKIKFRQIRIESNWNQSDLKSSKNLENSVQVQVLETWIVELPVSAENWNRLDPWSSVNTRRDLFLSLSSHKHNIQQGKIYFVRSSTSEPDEVDIVSLLVIQNKIHEE